MKIYSTRGFYFDFDTSIKQEVVLAGILRVQPFCWLRQVGREFFQMPLSPGLAEASRRADFEDVEI